MLPAALRSLRSEADYRAFAARFAVRRTHPGFWAHSDAALFDYNRLENR